jgi:hypothetical protein
MLSWIKLDNVYNTCVDLMYGFACENGIYTY